MLDKLGDAICPWEGKANPLRRNYCDKALALLKSTRQDLTRKHAQEMTDVC